VIACVNKRAFCAINVDFVLCIAHKSKEEIESINIDIVVGASFGAAANSTQNPTPSMKPAHKAEIDL
jgi:hypothetical protein